MRLPALLTSGLRVASLLVVAGCAGTDRGASVERAREWANAVPALGAVTKQACASQQSAGNIDCYKIVEPPGGAPVNNLGGLSGPSGISLGSSGARGSHGGSTSAPSVDFLYVAISGSAEILVLPPGLSPPIAALSDPGQVPVNVAIFTDGTVYVANQSTTSSGAGSISVYAPGATSPTSILTCPTFYRVVGVAVDRKGDVFVNQNTMLAKAEVDEFRAHSTKCRKLSISEGAAGGAGIDRAGNLLLADTSKDSISTYKAGTFTKIGTVHVPNAGNAIDFDLDLSGKLLYIADFLNGTIDVVDYPSGTYLGSYTSGLSPGGLVYGIAASPAQLPD